MELEAGGSLIVNLCEMEMVSQPKPFSGRGREGGKEYDLVPRPTVDIAGERAWPQDVC